MTSQRYDVELSETEYLRHTDGALMADVYMPKGTGPFPLMVHFHGGAWCDQTRKRERFMCRNVASYGIAMISVDFRQARDGAYPKSVADGNFAVRWAKANASAFRSRADLVGVAGQSSGGQIAMLIAMRPHDPRYTAIALPGASAHVDATVRCVEMTWPVINPLGRYRMARAWAKRDPKEQRAQGIMQKHCEYWAGGKNAELAQANMTDGSPLLILQRGERVTMPPAFWLQAPDDPIHVYHDPDSGEPGTDMDKFIAAYRKAGGRIDVSLDGFRAETEDVSLDPRFIEAQRQIAEFILRNVATAQNTRVTA